MFDQIVHIILYKRHSIGYYFSHELMHSTSHISIIRGPIKIKQNAVSVEESS
jgi:hypothetical protein